ncbi:MAG: hypothetical protein M3Y23_02425, partial [Actinomycetota bacterium]|nr:hypothetical protein [Actinomycetota bacterium]
MRRFLTLLVAMLAAALISAGLTGTASASEPDRALAAKVKKSAKKKSCQKGRKGKKCRAKKRRARAKARKARKAKPRLTVFGTSATQLAGGKVKVKVSAPKKSRVRLTSTSSTFDVPSSPLTTAKTVKVGRKGKRIVTLSLTADAKAAVAGCEARTLNFMARRNSNKRQAKFSRALVRDTAACQLPPVDLSRAADCDFIAQPKHGMCMLPFPNDYYTRDDPSSNTGKRIQFTEEAMPKNRQGVPINPDEYSQSDGFSQGQGIVVKIPGVETFEAVEANDLVPINHQGEYSMPDQRVLVIDRDTGKRWPIWANIDSNAGDPSKAVLEIKPAKNFDAKGNYIVALRNLTTVDGESLEAPTAFRYYRDDLPSDQAQINQRREHYEGIFETLKGAGVKRKDLYLAWDFTVASDENNYERVLSMRDRAFAELGDTTMADQI